MSQEQYIVPGNDFHDELVSEAEHIEPGNAFIVNRAENVETTVQSFVFAVT